MRMISSSARREAGSGLQSCVVAATSMAQARYDSNTFSMLYYSRISPSTSLAYSEYASTVPLDLSCQSHSQSTVNSASSSDATKHTTRKALEQAGSASFDYNASIPGVSGESSSRQLKEGTLVDGPALACPTCDFTFASTANFRKHVEHHEAGRRHLCRECGALCRTRHHLKEHSRTHTGERPYQCDVCDETFPFKKTLKRHKTTHTSERPFECHLCAAAYNRRDNLVRHIKKHHAEICERGAIVPQMFPMKKKKKSCFPLQHLLFRWKRGQTA